MSVLDEAARQIARPKANFEDFAAFDKKTGALWTWWARRLLRDVPPWLDADDLRQELMIEAWCAAGRWREGKGSKPGAWVAQAAIRRARKAVMRARGVNRHTWRFDEPSMHDVGVDEIEVRVDAEQESLLLGLELIQQVANEHGELAAIVVQAVAANDSDIASAAKMIYDDSESRFLFKLGSEREARQVVRDTVRRIAATTRR